jgi:glycosyltransferase involved in cell wall biosynthesis
VKVLVSAYACEPHKGSEPEVGLQTVLAAATQHEVWVLTRENNLPPLEQFLAGHPLAERIHLHGLDLGGRARRVKQRAGLLGLHWYYDRWQQAALGAARRLDHRMRFDLVHHATIASYWTRAGVAGLDKPFVWGPVGGGVRAPMRLLPELGPKGVVEDGVRRAMQWMLGHLGPVRVARRAATVILVQNEETARAIRAERTRVLPNAVAISLESFDPAPRSTEIAFVGRLHPLKGAHLAIRTLRYMNHLEAVLCIYGEGPERRRVERAASRWGLASRVEFAGHIPRSELIGRVASSAVLLHPALHEEAGLAVAEALALGTPVVCLDWGGPRALLKHWPASPATAVSPSGPETTARKLAGAVDDFLSDQPPARGRATDAQPPYRDILLGAYQEALGRS